MKVCGKIWVGNSTKLKTQVMSKTHPLVSEFARYNLSTFYVLPLIELSMFSFGENSNFINSYVSTDSKFIVVKVIEKLFLTQQLTMHPNFVRTVEDNGYSLLVYSIPKEFEVDVELYKQGAYSLLSIEAKAMILKYSGLAVDEIVDGVNHSDPRILALERAKTLKDFWIELLYDNSRESVLDDTDELLSKPSSKAFIEM